MTVSDTRRLSAESVVVRRNNIVEAEVDGEVVALDIDSGTCYGLNKVGSRIWTIIVEPRRIDEICVQLVGEYDVDMATCEREVLSLLEELLAENLIEARSSHAG